MLQKRIRLTSVVFLSFIFGMTGCSSGGSDDPTQVVVVAASVDDAGNATESNSENASADAGAEPDTDAGGTTDSNPDTDTTGNSTDSSSTTEGNQGTVGETTSETDTSGTVATDGDAAGTADDGELDSTATGGETTGTATDSGATTIGTETAGETAGSTTDTGSDSAGTSTADNGTTAGTATDTGTADGSDAGDEAGSTEGTVDDTTAGTGTDDGTTAGTDADGGTTEGTTTDAGATAGADTDGGDTGTTTDGTTSYTVGSLAYELSIRPDLSSALEALQEANLDEAINNPDNAWTLFLPTNEAFEALDSRSDFDIDSHIAGGSALSLDALSGFNGLRLRMDDERRLVVQGDGTVADPIVIADATVIEPNIEGDNGASIVHVIDKVIGEFTGPEFPPGSLADKLFTRDAGDMSEVINLLRAEDGRDAALIDPGFNWTLFLPNNAALEGAQGEFLGDNHIYEAAVLTSTDLTGMSGESIELFGGVSFEIGGGTDNEPLTIGGFEILESDLQRDDMEGAIVHIINGVLVPE